jgi:hypothetical protein
LKIAYPVELNQFGYLALPIRNIFDLQVGQTPDVAGLPFFIVIDLGVFISFLALHLTQYASISFNPPHFFQG